MHAIPITVCFFSAFRAPGPERIDDRLPWIVRSSITAFRAWFRFQDIPVTGIAPTIFIRVIILPWGAALRIIKNPGVVYFSHLKKIFWLLSLFGANCFNINAADIFYFRCIENIPCLRYQCKNTPTSINYNCQFCCHCCRSSTC